MPYKILIADDEKEVIELLSLYLEKDGFKIFTACDGISALNIASAETLDCIVLDIMMPKMNGFSLVKKIREKSTVPVIMLTARVTTSDKILGFDLGADDYITKPFDPLEAVARINANIRRYHSESAVQAHTEMHAGPLTLHIEKCLLERNGIEIELTSTEFRIMQLLMSYPGRVFTKEQIFLAGWGEDVSVEDNSIMVALSKLRSKLGGETWIRNIRNLGYRLEVKHE